MTALEILPAPLPRHVRVIRVEGINDFTQGGIRVTHKAKHPESDALLSGLWANLPNPYNDRYINRDPRPDEYCACDARWADKWWPEWARQYLAAEGLHMVVLDVPEQHAVCGEYQWLIKRREARVVAVLH